MKRSDRRRSLPALLALSCLASNAYCADWVVTGRLTKLEPTYSDHLNVQIDTGTGTCSAGAWLFFVGAGATAQEKKESVKAVYAGLLASMYQGKPVTFRA